MLFSEDSEPYLSVWVLWVGSRGDNRFYELKHLVLPEFRKLCEVGRKSQLNDIRGILNSCYGSLVGSVSLRK
jgi:hypothetical protein